MPVDPGNLLLLGERSAASRSSARPAAPAVPKENGFDWVLHRAARRLADPRRATSRAHGRRRAADGDRARGRSRAPCRDRRPDTAPQVAALVLAAGRSTRMGGPNKLLADYRGKPLVRIAARRARLEGLARHRCHRPSGRRESRTRSRASTSRFVHNPDYAEGLSTSWRRASARGARGGCGVICLGDMPRVDGALIDRLIAAFEPGEGRPHRRADGRRPARQPGPPRAALLRDLRHLEGDAGARQILKAHAEAIVEVPIEGEAARLDIDTPEALSALRVRGELARPPGRSDADARISCAATPRLRASLACNRAKFFESIFLTMSCRRAIVSSQAPCYDGAWRVDRASAKQDVLMRNALRRQEKRRSTGESA